jgi:2-isopropylmalate synthase
MKEKVYTFDTTLRDGLQGVGVTLSLDERIRIVNLLYDLGIDYIEAGFLGSNPTTDQLFGRLAGSKVREKIVVFGSTRKKNELVEESDNLKNLTSHTFPTVSIVGKTWPLHLRHVLGVTKEENLEIIRDSITYAKSCGKEVIYDAEHFFDAWMEEEAYALECLIAAREAKWITLCDTNGAHLPHQIEQATKAAVDLGLAIGIHTHNDAECAVANSLAAVRSGARLVQGTINGIGERCGNANLSSLLPDLEIKENYKTISQKNMKKLTRASRLIGEITKHPVAGNQPFVGPLAFVHKGGMHGSAIAKESRTFEHIGPERVGNESGVTLSEVAGRANLEEKLKEYGIKKDNPGKTLARLKDMEDKGYAYEQAEGSLYLFLKEENPSFEIINFHIKSSKKKSRARISIKKESETREAKGKGSGPVEALDKALREALRSLYPEAEHMFLKDYRVHIINSERGTKATTRVFIDASDGEEVWTTLGVSDNIIAASLEALYESYLYLIEKEKK